MRAYQDVLINNIPSHTSNLNPNAPVFVPRWLQPPMVVRQNATRWSETNDVCSITQYFPDNTKRRRIIRTHTSITPTSHS